MKTNFICTIKLDKAHNYIKGAINDICFTAPLLTVMKHGFFK